MLITQGSSARLTPETKSLPVDTVIIGIIDSVGTAVTMFKIGDPVLNHANLIAGNHGQGIEIFGAGTTEDYYPRLTRQIGRGTHPGQRERRIHPD